MEPSPHWPVWITEVSHPNPGPLNASLLELLGQIVPKERGSVWASDDDVLQRFGDHPGVRSLFQFLSDVVFHTAHQANQRVWAELGAPRVQVVMVGAWFQVQRAHGRHGVHNHGNCSWSGVYYVDGDGAERAAHPTLGGDNGVLRLHGPHLARSGGAHMDLGSAYLQRSARDVAPEPGRAVVFPSWLLHETLPYEGDRERVVVAFNAQLRASDGGAGLPYGF